MPDCLFDKTFGMLYLKNESGHLQPQKAPCKPGEHFNVTTAIYTV